MKKLNIPLAAGTKVDAALVDVNGRARNPNILGRNDLIELAQMAEDMLEDRGVSESNRVGSCLCYRCEGPSCNSYGYSRESTYVELRRVRGGQWHLVAADRQPVWPRTPQIFKLIVSEKAERNIVAKAMHGFMVRRKPETAVTSPTSPATDAVTL